MMEVAEAELWLSSTDSGDAIEDPDVRHLFDYWKAAAGGNLAPRRADIDPPIDLTRFLPTTLMFDIERDEHGALSFRYRVMGTRLVDIAGRDLRGQTIDEVFGMDFVARDIEIYEQVVERCACYSGWRISMIESRQLFERYHRFVMPVMGDESGRIDRIWTWITYDDVTPSGE